MFFFLLLHGFFIKLYCFCLCSVLFLLDLRFVLVRSLSGFVLCQFYLQYVCPSSLSFGPLCQVHPISQFTYGSLAVLFSASPLCLASSVTFPVFLQYCLQLCLGHHMFPVPSSTLSYTLSQSLHAAGSHSCTSSSCASPLLVFLVIWDIWIPWHYVCNAWFKTLVISVLQH